MSDKTEAILRAKAMLQILQTEEIIKKQHLERWNKRLLMAKYQEDELKVKELSETELMIASYHNELAENCKHSNFSLC